MKILVTGGRLYGQVAEDCPRDMLEEELLRAARERVRLYESLDEIKTKRGGISCVVEGGAEGADRIAHNWAMERNVPTVRYSADWKTYGRAAGPVRNQQMIDEEKPDLIVACKGGKGTADMIARAERHRIRIVYVP